MEDIKSMKTLTINGRKYEVEDPDAVRSEVFNQTMGDIETALDAIIAIQESLIGGSANTDPCPVCESTSFDGYECHDCGYNTDMDGGE